MSLDRNKQTKMYEEILEMFQMPGWEHLEQAWEQNKAVCQLKIERDADSLKDLYTCQTEIKLLSELLNYKNTVELNFEVFQRDAMEDEDVA